jgi:4-hydroxybenzoate polyprenyltransferase
MSKFVKGVLAIMMPNRALTLCISFLAGMLLADNLDLQTMLLGVLMLTSAYCAQAVFNNICDVEGDRINDPRRPLASGLIGIRFAWMLMFALVGSSFIIGSLISPIMVFVNIFYVMIGFLYSKITKARWLLSYSTLVTSHMAVPLLTGYMISGALDAKIALIVGFVYLTEVLAFSIKDYKDIEGDRQMGMRTLPIVFDVKKASTLTGIGLALPLVLVWIPWQTLSLSPLFLALYMLAGGIRFWFARRLTADPSPTSAGYILKNFRYVLLLQMGAWCLA